MNGEPTPPPGEPPAPAAQPATGPRPWTPAAAMEPLPPLAPPPARPGAGMPVVAAARASSQGTHRAALGGVAVLSLVVIAVVIVVLALHH